MGYTLASYSLPWLINQRFRCLRLEQRGVEVAHRDDRTTLFAALSTKLVKLSIDGNRGNERWSVGFECCASSRNATWHAAHCAFLKRNIIWGRGRTRRDASDTRRYVTRDVSSHCCNEILLIQRANLQAKERKGWTNPRSFSATVTLMLARNKESAL